MVWYRSTSAKSNCKHREGLVEVSEKKRHLTGAPSDLLGDGFSSGRFVKSLLFVVVVGRSRGVVLLARAPHPLVTLREGSSAAYRYQALKPHGTSSRVTSGSTHSAPVQAFASAVRPVQVERLPQQQHRDRQQGYEDQENLQSSLQQMCVFVLTRLKKTTTFSSCFRPRPTCPG